MKPKLSKPLAVAALSLTLLTATNAKASTIILNDEGQYCREYSQSVTVGGRAQNSYGTACLQPDGQWQIQNSADHRNNTIITNNAPPVVYQPPTVIYTQPPVTRYIVRTRPVYAPPPVFYAYRYPQPRHWDRHHDHSDRDDRAWDRHDRRR